MTAQLHKLLLEQPGEKGALRFGRRFKWNRRLDLKRFAVYGYPGRFEWLVSELVARRVPTYIAGEFAGRLLLMVEPSASTVTIRGLGSSGTSEGR